MAASAFAEPATLFGDGDAMRGIMHAVEDRVSAAVHDAERLHPGGALESTAGHLRCALVCAQVVCVQLICLAYCTKSARSLSTTLPTSIESYAGQMKA